MTTTTTTTNNVVEALKNLRNNQYIIYTYNGNKYAIIRYENDITDIEGLSRFTNHKDIGLQLKDDVTALICFSNNFINNFTFEEKIFMLFKEICMYEISSNKPYNLLNSIKADEMVMNILSLEVRTAKVLIESIGYKISEAIEDAQKKHPELNFVLTNVYIEHCDDLIKRSNAMFDIMVRNNF